MPAYYNEFDPKAAAWLRELMKGGHIPEGEVDERSIADVRPADLAGFTQCHFFAGIGGWPYALRLAGWPDDREVWTGSCPCQPFSAAGKGDGASDARHLWPEFGRLIQECRPPVVFGEQVASALGRLWLTAVRLDLEAMGYAVGAADLCAAGVGAPHIRQRLFWVADAERGAAERWGHDVGAAAGSVEGEARERERLRDDDGASGPTRGLADAVPAGRAEGRAESGRGSAPSGGGFGGVADPLSERGRRGPAGLENASDARLTGEAGGSRRPGFWDALKWLPCRDGKARPTQPGLFPLAHGVSGRVGLLRGYGNAIVPQVAAAFIEAYTDALT